MEIEKFLLNNKIWLDVGVALGTLGTTIIAAAPTIDRYLMRTRFDFSIDEKIGVVISDQNHLYKIHLGLRLINKSNKDLLVNRIVATIINSKQKKFVFDWNMFVQDIGSEVESRKRPAPIFLPPRSSHYEMVQFFIHPEKDMEYVLGRSKLKLDIWVNKDKISVKPTKSRSFFYEIDQTIIDAIKKEKNNFQKRDFEGRCPIVHIPIDDWCINKLTKI